MHVAAPDADVHDCDVLRLLRSGQRDRAFDAVLEQYEGKVYRLCCGLLRDRALAEDVAQESLLRVWKALDSYDGRASVSTWIYAITRNRCLTALQRRRAMDSLSDSEVAAEMEDLTTSQAEDSGEHASLLRELVDLLPERLRRTMVLYYFEDRSTSEVALMLGCPEGTVKTHLFRARAALTEQLKKRGLHDASLWLDVTS